MNLLWSIPLRVEGSSRGCFVKSGPTLIFSGRLIFLCTLQTHIHTSYNQAPDCLLILLQITYIHLGKVHQGVSMKIWVPNIYCRVDMRLFSVIIKPLMCQCALYCEKMCLSVCCVQCVYQESSETLQTIYREHLQRHLNRGNNSFLLNYL